MESGGHNSSVMPSNLPHEDTAQDIQPRHVLKTVVNVYHLAESLRPTGVPL